MPTAKLVAGAAVAALVLGVAACKTPPAPGPGPGPGPGPAPAAVNAKRELWITNVSVVDDARARGTGPWSFGGLMRAMAPSEAQAGQFTKDWLSTWTLTTPVNTFPMDRRDGIKTRVIDRWMARDGAADFATWNPNFDNAPFRLLGVVYRPDLIRFEGDSIVSAGEGRLVFNVLDGPPNAPASRSLRFTVIFEYGLVGTSRADVKAWADRFHALGAIPFGAPYNTALQEVTDRFTRRGANPSKPNGSSLNQLRTNEFVDEAPWQLREFRLTPAGALAFTTVKQNPDLTADRAALSAFINANAAAVKAQTHVIPEQFQGRPLLSGHSDVQGNNPGFFWPRMSITDNDARHSFSLNTCNGCHNGETGNERNPGSMLFRHVSTRDIGEEARLSGFLRGANVPDKVNPGVTRRFNDLAARTKALQEALVLPPPTAEATPSSGLSVALSRKGRVD